jgi:hypothetical protein
MIMELIANVRTGAVILRNEKTNHGATATTTAWGIEGTSAESKQRRFRARVSFLGRLLHLGLDFLFGLQPVIPITPVMAAASLMDFKGALPHSSLDKEQIFARRRATVDFAV